MIFVCLHDFNNEIGHFLNVREDVLDDFLHVTIKKSLAILADEYEVTLEVVLVPVVTFIHQLISLEIIAITHFCSTHWY